VVVFQVLDPREVALDYRGEVEFTDLEAPDRSVRTEPAHVRSGYLRRLDEWRGYLRRECRRRLIDLVELTTDTPLEQGLGAYLLKRGRLY
jgi:hypothetical protein